MPDELREGEPANDRPSLDKRKLENELDQIHRKEEELIEDIEREHVLEEHVERELQELRSENHFFLVFIINGEDYKIRTEPSMLLREAVEKALLESGNTGRRDASEWEVRNSAGALLDSNREIRHLGLEDDAKLFLSLKVGAGGN